ncbi:MAG: YbbR-like domain-containing protein [Deltaproteobacteria bacterium]|nr:YbbR-like domain-containing protein [Deltaproteobacteria bacterium]MBW2360403.1 YbbR-like domain-containing protein [Deltaproteobacteria bacterium]
MARSARSGNLRYALLSVVIAMVLWTVARGGSTHEAEYDIPVVFADLPDTLVITDQTASKINVRVRGSRAAFRSVPDMEYIENVGGAVQGRARYELDGRRLGLPRGVRVVGLSPAQLDVVFERVGRKNVRIRADVQGEPPEGFELGDVVIEPSRIWLTGARSRVLALKEVVTETIDVSQLQETAERDVTLSIGSEHVWLEEEQTITVKVPILPLAPPDETAGSPPKRPRAG